jgi:hypothetical protein
LSPLGVLVTPDRMPPPSWCRDPVASDI